MTINYSYSYVFTILMLYGYNKKQNKFPVTTIISLGIYFRTCSSAGNEPNEQKTEKQKNNEGFRSNYDGDQGSKRQGYDVNIGMSQ